METLIEILISLLLLMFALIMIFPTKKKAKPEKDVFDLSDFKDLTDEEKEEIMAIMKSMAGTYATCNRCGPFNVHGPNMPAYFGAALLDKLRLYFPKVYIEKREDDYYVVP